MVRAAVHDDVTRYPRNKTVTRKFTLNATSAACLLALDMNTNRANYHLTRTPRDLPRRKGEQYYTNFCQLIKNTLG